MRAAGAVAGAARSSASARPTAPGAVPATAARSTVDPCCPTLCLLASVSTFALLSEPARFPYTPAEMFFVGAKNRSGRVPRQQAELRGGRRGGGRRHPVAQPAQAAVERHLDRVRLKVEHFRDLARGEV